MLETTAGLVLRTVKYGETSLVATIFTRTYGVQPYLIQGIRAAGKKGHSRAGMLQPGSLLEMVVYLKSGGGLHRMREFASTHIYSSIHEEVLKNSVALFSVELLLRLMPAAAPAPELFDFCQEYFIMLDAVPAADIGNYPLYFTLQCSRYLGYEIQGRYTEETPYLNATEGSFTAAAPLLRGGITVEDAAAMGNLLQVRSLKEANAVMLNGAARQRLLEWFLQFLHRHTDHMSPIRSLAVLHSVLHG